MKVTVIIPVHNSEKYLEECIQSARFQSFSDLEILCIDGGSVDASAKIIKKIQNKDIRIQYLFDPNTSYGHKINVGIDRARGSYICILESDDRMHPDMLDTLVNLCEKYDLDVADADFNEVFFYKGRELRNGRRKYADLKCCNHYIKNKDYQEISIAYNGIWTALYKREFLISQNIRLHESPGASYQDLSFLFLTGLLADSLYHIDVPLYDYRIDNASSSVKDDRKIFEIIGECRFLKEEIEKRGIRDPYVWQMYYIRKYNAYYWNYCRLTPEARDKFCVRYVQELTEDAAAGRISRKMFPGNLYARTYLLLDDKETFEIEAVKAIEKTTAIGDYVQMFEKAADRGIVLFGAGAVGQKALDMLLQNGNKIYAICDNSEKMQGITLNGYPVYTVEDVVLKYPCAVYLIANRKYTGEMKEQLLSKGILEHNIAVFPLSGRT